MDAAGRVIEPKPGTPQVFWVRVPNDTFGLIYQYAQKSATLKRTGVHCYMFVEDGSQVPDSVLDDLETAYDANIYPTCRRYFGSEWNPGIDGDSIVTILLSSSQFAEFYFSPFDEMPESLAQKQKNHSNEREMFYIRPGEDLQRMDADMAHCQEHLIHRWQNPPGEAWLDEACAMYAMDLCGFGSTIREIQDFQNNSSVDIGQWPSGIVDLPLLPTEPVEARRGAQYAFLAYLADNFPGKHSNDPMIYHLVARRALGDSIFFKPLGFMNVAMALYETGGPPSFVEPYIRWTVANFVNDTLLQDHTPGYPPRPFGYTKPLGGDPHFLLQPMESITTYPESLSLETPWYGQWYVYVQAGKPNLKVQVDQDSAIWFDQGRTATLEYRGYFITSTTEDFTPGTNALFAFPSPWFQTGFSESLTADIKGVKIIPSLPLARNGAPPNFYVYAYLPFNPGDTTLNRTPYVYPNPFNPNKERVHFHYVVAQQSKVDIRVYDAAGNQLALVTEDLDTGPGIYDSQTWDGRNYRGTPVANGVYFGRVKIGNKTTGVKIAVMR